MCAFSPVPVAGYAIACHDASFATTVKVPVCIGQKQKWFLLQLQSTDTRVNLTRSQPAEFDGWRWVSYWYPLNQVVSFKREVYRRALIRIGAAPALARMMVIAELTWR
jgi:putative (di)nucleoside polyphosphate hydrolase